MASNEHVLSRSASPWSLNFEAKFDRLESAIENEVNRDKRKKDTSADDGEI